MALAEAVYTRSHCPTREQPYQLHRPASPAPKESWQKRSPGRVIAIETGVSAQSGMYALRFGRFRLVLHSRELLAGGVPLSVGNRAMDVLFALIEAQGLLVTKDELLNRVWPNTTVEENNLQFQISTLRKVLGEDRDLIRTVSGRGYRFVAEVTPEYRSPRPAVENAALRDEQDAAIGRLRDLPDPHNFAEPALDAGREVHLKELGAKDAAHCLVALARADGIGKMHLAFELARRAVPTFANGVGIAACGTMSGPKLVPTMVASESGLDETSNALARAAASLNPEHLLLLLNSCEHIIETVTSVAEALLQANAKL